MTGETPRSGARSRAGFLALGLLFLTLLLWLWLEGAKGPGLHFWVLVLAGGAALFLSEAAPKRLYRRFNTDLFALLVLMFLARLPFVSGRSLPSHDTLHALEIFQYFYRALLFHNQIPQWVPEVLYGAPAASMQLGQLSPPMLLVMALGKIFSITNVLLLFRASMVCEFMVLAFGTYLLARSLFSNRTAILFAGMVLLLANFFSYQLNFGFRILYSMPLVLFCVHRFFTRHEPLWFWLSGMAAVLSLLGGLSYYAGLWLLAVGAFALPLAVNDPRAFRTLVSASRGNLYGMIGFAVTAALVVAFGANGYEYLIIGTARDPFTGKSTLATFLTWPEAEPQARFFTLAKSWALGWPVTLNQTRYLGLATLVFFLYSLVRVRKTPFYAVILPGAALFLLAFGGFFATLFYFFPGMGYFRYIMLTNAFLGLFIALAAGFGISRFFRMENRQGLLLVLFTLLMFALVDLLAAPVIREILFNGKGLGVIPGIMDSIRGLLASDAAWRLDGAFDLEARAVVLFRVLVYGGLGCLVLLLGFVTARGTKSRWAFPKKAAQVVLLLALLTDLASFRTLYELDRPGVPETWPREALAATPIPWLPERLPPEVARENPAVRFVDQHDGSRFVTTYAFAGIDVCWPEYYTPWYTATAVHLYRLGREAVLADPVLQKTLGCGGPKLRIVPGAVFAQGLDEAAGLLHTMKSPDETVILYGNGDGGQPAAFPADAPQGSASVTAFSPNRVEIEARVPWEGGGWLVYADSWSPGWGARVNGNPAAIATAYPSFKAVRLAKGESRVAFSYDAGPVTWLSHATALLGALGALALLVGLFAVLFRIGDPLPATVRKTGA